jgi:hypothetical protein
MAPMWVRVAKWREWCALGVVVGLTVYIKKLGFEVLCLSDLAIYHHFF